MRASPGYFKNIQFDSQGSTSIAIMNSYESIFSHQFDSTCTLDFCKLKDSGCGALYSSSDISINANYQYTPRLSANIATNYIGKRLDEDDSQLSSYLVTNIALIYKIHQHVTLSARLDNAFNDQYKQISDYDADERTIYIGIKLH